MRAVVAFGLLVLAIIYFAAIVEASVSAAQKSQILSTHNAERAKPKVTPKKKLPALKWSAAGAKSAQAWANKCQFKHNVPKGYGQNLAAGTGYSVPALIKLWINEKSHFSNQKITMAVVNKAGHYTQLVWAKTTSVGCGISSCKGLGTYLVCNYHPPGNYLGQKAYVSKGKRFVEDVEEQVEMEMPAEFYEMARYALEENNGCTPNATCADEMADCGPKWDGCDYTDCGSCSDSTTSCSVDNNCVADDTVCKPTLLCSDLGRTCGSLFNGCNTTSCGTCDTGFDCITGKCVAAKCETACDEDQTCVNAKCVCRAGMDTNGDGSCSPTPVFPTDPNEDVTVWNNNNGKWVATSEQSDDAIDGLSHLASGQEDIILWSKSDIFAVSRKVSVSAVFTPSDNADFGLLFRAADAKNYYAVAARNGKVSFEVVRNGKKISTTPLGAATLDEFGSVELRVVASGQTFVVYVNGVKTPAGKSLRENTITTVGQVGLFAVGAVNVSEVHHAPSRNIKLHIGTCDNLDKIIAALPGLLGVNPNAITDILPPVCTKKRDGVMGADITFEVAGSNAADVEAAQSTLSSVAESSGELMAESGMVPVAASDAGVAFISESIALEIAGEVVAAAAVSSAVIAGAVVAGVVGAGAIGAGAVVIHKKRVAKKNGNKLASPSLESVSPAAKPKGAGANVFSFDPNNSQSITGRTPAQKL